LPRIEKLFAYWRNYPPMNILVAAFLGVKPKSKKPKSSQDLNQMMAELSALGFSADTGGKK